MYEQADIIEVKPPSMRNKCRLEHSIDGSKSDIPLENFLINSYYRSQQKQRYPDIQSLLDKANGEHHRQRN